MKKVQLIAVGTLLLTHLNFSEIIAQNELRDYYNWFDKQVGIENTSIFNGKRYFEKYRVLNGKHKFFSTHNFLKGDIVYENQPYYDMDLQYDLFEGQIILKIQSGTRTSILQLDKNKIQSFNIKGKNFVHIINGDAESNSKMKSDFYEELIVSKNMALYKKNRKSRDQIIKKNTIYSKFKLKNEYYLLQNKSVNQISKKNDLIILFPEEKRFINSYFRNNKKLLKTDYDVFLVKLVSELSGFSSQVR